MNNEQRNHVLGSNV